MLSTTNDTTAILGLNNVIITNVKEDEVSIHIYLEQERKPCLCPICKRSTSYVYDYRTQIIKDLHFRGKPCYLHLKKRRLVCKQCQKRFYQKPDFLPRYHRMTRRVIESIIDKMRNNFSMKSVAKEHNVSAFTIARVFDIVNYSLQKLPTVLSIDEFKGNAGGEKYQAILTDPVKKKVLDILPSRQQSGVFSYFFNRKDRERVNYIVIDMWRPYYEMAKILFPKAKIIIDKYHYIRQIYWALERVRKRVQKNMTDAKRIYFKRSKKLLWTDYDKLSTEGKYHLERMLSESEDLDLSWQLKELFVSFRKSKNAKEGRIELNRWLEVAKEAKLPDYAEAITALTNWKEEILNSLDYPYTNGFTEGCNNRIKVIKRNAFGLRNFNRFRNRIIHCCA